MEKRILASILLVSIILTSIFSFNNISAEELLDESLNVNELIESISYDYDSYSKDGVKTLDLYDGTRIGVELKIKESIGDELAKKGSYIKLEFPQVSDSGEWASIEGIQSSFDLELEDENTDSERPEDKKENIKIAEVEILEDQLLVKFTDKVEEFEEFEASINFAIMVRNFKRIPTNTVDIQTITTDFNTNIDSLKTRFNVRIENHGEGASDIYSSANINIDRASNILWYLTINYNRKDMFQEDVDIVFDLEDGDHKLVEDNIYLRISDKDEEGEELGQKEFIEKGYGDINIDNNTVNISIKKSYLKEKRLVIILETEDRSMSLGKEYTGKILLSSGDIREELSNTVEGINVSGNIDGSGDYRGVIELRLLDEFDKETPIKDGLFKIYRLDEGLEEVGEVRTDRDGIGRTGEVSNGTYRIEQVSTAKGYEKLKDHLDLEVSFKGLNTGERVVSQDLYNRQLKKYIVEFVDEDGEKLIDSFEIEGYLKDEIAISKYLKEHADEFLDRESYEFLASYIYNGNFYEEHALDSIVVRGDHDHENLFRLMYKTKTSYDLIYVDEEGNILESKNIAGFYKDRVDVKDHVIEIDGYDYIGPTREFLELDRDSKNNLVKLNYKKIPSKKIYINHIDLLDNKIYEDEIIELRQDSRVNLLDFRKKDSLEYEFIGLQDDYTSEEILLEEDIKLVYVYGKPVVYRIEYKDILLENNILVEKGYVGERIDLKEYIRSIEGYKFIGIEGENLEGKYIVLGEDEASNQVRLTYEKIEEKETIEPEKPVPEKPIPVPEVTSPGNVSENNKGNDGYFVGQLADIKKEDEKPIAEKEEIIEEKEEDKIHLSYINGYPDGTIRPESNITREEAITIFYRVLDGSSQARTENTFTDIKPDRWSENYIASMYKSGLIKGYSDGRFKPEASLTRGEMATIISRIEDRGSIDEGRQANFIDIASHWAKDNITTAYRKNWINGYEDNSFRPDEEISRAEFVAIVNRILNRKVKLENILPETKDYRDLNDKTKWYYTDMLEALNSHTYVREESSEDSEIWLEVLDK